MLLKGEEKPSTPDQASGISLADLDLLERNPTFPGAVRDLLARLIKLYDANPLLNRVLCDRGRVMVSLFALYLHYLPPPGEREAGLTLSRLQALCRSTGLCSSGRTAAMVSVMRFGGYLVPGVSGHDRRQRVLVPTDRFLAEQQQRWRILFEAMARLYPSAGEVLGVLDQPEFTTAFLRRLGQSYFAGYRVLDSVPALAGLIESNAALLMLGDLMLRSGIDPAAQDGQSVSVSTSALARRFGVARAHVRNLLVAAERVELLRYGDEGSRMIVLPALSAAIETFFAATFLLFSGCGASAIEEMRLQTSTFQRRSS